MNTIKKFKPGVLHLLSHVRLFSDPVDCSMQSFTISWSLLRLVPIESVMPSERLILYHSLLLLLSIFPSIRVFSSELALCIRWTKYWSFSFSSILPMNVQGWFPLGWTVGAPCSQWTLKSLLQHHSPKASISSVHSLFTCPALTSIYDYWKNNRFD